MIVKAVRKPGTCGEVVKSADSKSVMSKDANKAIPPIDGVGIWCIFLIPGKSSSCLL
jgi:hypothetical protein